MRWQSVVVVAVRLRMCSGKHTGGISGNHKTNKQTKFDNKKSIRRMFDKAAKIMKHPIVMVCRVQRCRSPLFKHTLAVRGNRLHQKESSRWFNPELNRNIHALYVRENYL